ncbi:hypothetical protein ACLI4U_04935 [Natrialbaceae archaeon A-CW2]
MLDYYDAILVAIIGSLVAGVLVSAVSALTIHAGIFVGSLVAIVFVCDAMIRRPPVAASSEPHLVAADGGIDDSRVATV